MTKEEKERAWLVSVLDKVLVSAFIQYRLDKQDHGWDIWVGRDDTWSMACSVRYDQAKSETWIEHHVLMTAQDVLGSLLNTYESWIDERGEE